MEDEEEKRIQDVEGKMAKQQMQKLNTENAKAENKCIPKDMTIKRNYCGK